MAYIIPRLVGGLGNQLFTFSAAYVIQQLHKQIILVPPPTENIHSQKNYNDIFLKFPDVCQIDLPPLTPEKFYELSKQIGATYVCPQRSSFAPWEPQTIPSGQICLEGYFQYYPALADHLPEIRKFILSAIPSVNIPTNCVFIHVRRGDYVEKSAFHYLQSDSYYLDALSHFDTTATLFLIISDDPTHCKEREIFKRLPYVAFIDTPNEIEALAIMAACKGGAICANSTFSWWGAILANPQKVFVPSNWSAEKPVDLFPPNWQQI